MFSAKENFRKILKVSHFSSGFSLDEKCDEINTFHRVSPEFSYLLDAPQKAGVYAHLDL